MNFIAKIKNLYLVFIDQLPLSRLIRNFKKGHLKGLFSERSHFRFDGTPKIKYNTKQSAQHAASSMFKKRGIWFSNYKCPHCDGYHIGKNSQNKSAK